MKAKLSFNQIVVIAIFATCFLPSCIAVQGIVAENDVVFASNRHKAEFVYNFPQELFSPLIRINQTIVKEINKDANETYKVYDIVTLNSRSFRVNDDVYWIIDNQPFRVKVDQIESAAVSQIEENRKDILTADSTTISVVTGYDQNLHRVNHIAYTVDKSIIDRIKYANRVQLRYYAGPNMVTVRMNTFDLNRIKNLINSR
jgi:hypothetical protein